MDKNDLEACGIEKDIQHFKCSALQDVQLRASSLSGLGTFPDEIARFEKKRPYHDHETKSCKAAKLPETERKCLSYDNGSATGCARQNTDGLNAPCSVVSWVSDSASMNKSCAKGTVMVMSPCNVLANERNSKDADISSHSMVAINCSHNISMKNDTSSEAGETPDKHENELSDGRTAWLNAEENRLKSIVQGTYHNKQLKTESSSSNFTRAIFPASSNDSCEETSVDDKPSKCCQTDITDTSICTGLKCRSKEPAASSSTLDLAMQNCCRDVLGTNLLPGKMNNLDSVLEASDNVRASGDRLLGVITDHRSVIVERDDILKSSLPMTEYAGPLNQDKAEHCYELDDALEVARRVAREVEQEVELDRQASRNSSCVLGGSCEIVHLNADSLALDKENYVTKTGGEIPSCAERDNYNSFHSNKEVVDQETLMAEQQMHLDIVESSLDLRSTITCAANCRQESSSIIAISDDLAANERIVQPFQVDLNADIVADEVKCTEQLVDETATYHVYNVSKPTPAMAKSGIPVYLPLSRFQLEDAVGWKGPSATSAFSPTSLSKNFKGIQAPSANDNGYWSKGLQVKGFDLNIAAATVDFDMELLQEKCVPESSLPSKTSLVEVSLTQAERLNIDLNFANEYDDNCFQMAPPTSSRNTIQDFDLNDNPTCQDACSNSDQPSQCTLGSGDRALDIPAVSFLGNAGQQRFNNLGSAYRSDPGPMQVFSHGNAGPFLLAVSNVLPTAEQMQEIVPLHDRASCRTNPPLQPTFAFPYGNGCCIEPSDYLSSAGRIPGVIPCITDQNRPTVFQQLVDSGTLPAFSGYTSFLQIPDGPRPNSIAIIRPGFDLNNGVTFENRSMGENVRPQFVPPGNSLMEEQMKPFQPVSLPATPMKRRKPDGRWRPGQLGYRQAM
ncbi:uncharacterized protein LOC111276757 [Durio zibethinus]|uniref:Uncharacterized protein LOC111276757 n=1 Tax=Durio zibethinus TaxID=66656 RepID=A0A6P5WQ67_DURZI|nr:uncharacterized protein LOC111276757 [Durio zibethinus]